MKVTHVDTEVVEVDVSPPAEASASTNRLHDQPKILIEALDEGGDVLWMEVVEGAVLVRIMWS